MPPVDSAVSRQTSDPKPATVAIVGRPNVGKSALFNRLIGRRLAIVEETPGVTRDRLYGVAEWRGRTFSVVDTAGIDPDAERGAGEELARAARRQAEAAAAEADVIVFVVDAAAGWHPLDEEVARILRRTRKPVLTVANKAESPAAAAAIHAEFARLGFEPLLAVSALHGEGTGDLLDGIVAHLPDEIEAPPEDELAVAIVGRPNVGKSSLLNALLGEERAVVSPIPGTTRDAIDTLLEWRGRRLRLIDTAGVRKRPEALGSIEYYAALRAVRAVARSDVALLVFDAMQGLTHQDKRLAGLILEEGKGLVLLGNKWDLVREQGEYQQAELVAALREQLPFASFAPIAFLSALTGRRLGHVLPLALRVAENRARRIPTARLNMIVRSAVVAHPPPSVGGTMLKIYYASQPQANPPRFIFSCNDPELVRPNFVRYLERVLREHADFEGVPLALEFRPRRTDEEG